MTCEQANVKVTIDDIEVPAITYLSSDDPQGSQTRIRRDGKAALTYHTDVHSALEWQGQDYWNQIGVKDGGFGHKFCDVQYRTPDGQYATVHRGPLTGAGSGPSAQNHVRYRIGDYSQWLNRLPVTKVWSDDVSPERVATFVTNAFENNSPITIDYEIDDPLEGGTDLSAFQSTGATFTRNKHTLADILDEMRFPWALIPNTDPNFEGVDMTLAISLSTVDFQFAPDQLFADTRSFVAESANTGDGASVSVIKNNSLKEIQPINTVQINGPVEVSPTSVVTSEQQGATFPYAKAVHTVLKSRAGGRELGPKDKYKEKISDTSKLEITARSELHNMIEGATGGTMQIRGDPRPAPYNTITAPPACGGFSATDVDPLTFEIQRVRHIASAIEGYYTEIDTSIVVDTDDIEITSGTKPVKPSGPQTGGDGGVGTGGEDGSGNGGTGVGFN